MATMPSRDDTAPQALASILPQVSRLWLFLDRFESIPAYALNERIRVLRSQEWGDLRANGKLLGLVQEDDPCTFFSLDDDVEYPPDYCAELEKNLDRFGGQTAVGVHAATLSTPVRSYVRDMTVMHRRGALERAIEVDLLGTDSTAFRTSTLQFDVREWPTVNMVDLSFALTARERAVPLIAVARAHAWIDPLAERQHDSIWLAVKNDDTAQTALARKLVELPRPLLDGSRNGR
jgi:hypothetical protein